MFSKTVLIVIAVIAVAAVVSAGVVWYILDSQDKELTFDNFLGLFNLGEDDSGSGSGEGLDDLFEDVDDDGSSDHDETEDYRFPTSLTIFVSPSPIDMGDWVVGTASTNGYNFAIDTKVDHTGSGQTQNVAGWVDSDGQYELVQPVNLPGYWEFQTTAENGVKSNVAYLTVRGMQVNLETSHYSKTLRDSMELRVFTHYAGEYVTFIADDGATMTPLGTVRTNSGGYATLDYSFDGPLWPYGNYEIDVEFGSDSASAWGGTAWVDVGR